MYVCTCVYVHVCLYVYVRVCACAYMCAPRTVIFGVYFVHQIHDKNVLNFNGEREEEVKTLTLERKKGSEGEKGREDGGGRKGARDGEGRKHGIERKAGRQGKA